MSHREGRDLDSKRHRPRFDRESSPKWSRRDRKQVQERNNLDNRDTKNELAIESQLPKDSKLESGSRSKEPGRRSEVDHRGKKRSSNPTEGTRPRSHFQHDQQVGRSSARGATGERGWWRDSRDRLIGNTENKNTTNESLRRRDDNSKIESDNAQPVRKRPAFQENKIQLEDSRHGEKASGEASKPTHQEESRREERGRWGRHLDRSFRVPNKRELQRAGVPWRGRNQRDGGDDYGREERFGVRPGFYSGSGGRGEKWKHDLYRDQDKSPTPKNEEDQIAKVEALLAS